jgi:GNAT superfamily N-acetyltransferase
MNVTKAKNKRDWKTASNLLVQVVDRLNDLERSLWTKEQVSVASLQQSYQLEELHFLVEDDLIGLVFLQDSDPLFWPEITNQDSLYIHKLAIDPTRAGEQLGEKALSAIILEASKRGFNWIRLDCDDRPELHRFYQDNGFEMIDKKQVGDFLVARYQLQISKVSTTL